MKKILFLSLLLFAINLNCQIVTGHLIYKKCCEHSHQEVKITYLGKEQKFVFNKLDSSKVRHLLQSLMPDEKIITARGMKQDRTCTVAMQLIMDSFCLM